MTQQIFIGGVEGVGKTSILNMYKDKYGTQFLLIFEFGSYMKKRAFCDGMIKTEADFFQLDSERIKILDDMCEEALQGAIRSSRYSHILIGGHYIFPTLNGFNDIFNSEKMRYNCLILIECEITELVRRINRNRKYRPIKYLNQLQRYIHLEKETAFRLAKKNNIPFFIIKNTRLEDAGDQLYDIIDKNDRFG